MGARPRGPIHPVRVVRVVRVVWVVRPGAGLACHSAHVGVSQAGSAWRIGVWHCGPLVVCESGFCSERFRRLWKRPADT